LTSAIHGVIVAATPDSAEVNRGPRPKEDNMTDDVTTVLTDLEHRYWQAIRDKDAATVMRLSDEPTIVAGASGAGSFDRATLGEIANSPSYVLTSYELTGFQVREIADGLAVVVYSAHEDLVVEGEAVSMDATEASTWVRRDGEWVCALHCESIAGDPFGRDRRPIAG
jgi:hypothetical protein